MNRLSLLMAIPLALLMASCAVPSRQLPAGELGRQYTAAIPGTWRESGGRAGMNIAMVKSFSRDGTARGVLYFKKNNPGYSFVMPEIPFTSRWRVKGDVTECYDIQTEIPGLFKKGEVIRDHLISVTPDRIVYRAEKGGGICTLIRVK